ncbi:RNA-directed DNA polymerase, eukaryota [Artemisia annua]|uniref:RNA-directed DNA polymerase, eukaryota n=1 Tax=Artemisia annua TaxID=35608 RepID=A0A2U1PTD9_ARTAN|nr:RNA-directed DNA polymerase, eukaryota [Artemisia annua]
MANVIGCNVGSLPFKYLGISVGANMNKISNWKPVYDVFESRLSKWKAESLSIGGRVTLIKSVLESLPSYFFSLYKAPCKVIKDLESLSSRFLWGGSKDVHKIHWVAWDKVCQPKDRGGLGLCKLKHINVALLSKWGWRFKKERGNLWCEVIEACHVTKRSWDYLPVRNNFSGTWSSIVKVLNRTMVGGLPLRQFFKGNVGNGNCISFWIDPWLLNIPLKDVCPHLFRVEAEKRCKVSDRLKLSDSGLSRVWNWKSMVMGVEAFSEWDILSSLLDAAALSSEPDCWKWIGVGNGDFSVRAVRSLLSEDAACNSNAGFVWCKWVPSKCNIFGWRAVMGRIPTARALRNRNIQVLDANCVLCGDEEESVDHLFTGCIFSARIWQLISAWCKVQNFFAFSFKDLLEVHKFVGLSGKAKDIFYGIIIVGCWCIWRARNLHKFQNKHAKVEETLGEIKSLGFLWAKHRAKIPSLNWDLWCKFVFM